MILPMLGLRPIEATRARAANVSVPEALSSAKSVMRWSEGPSITADSGNRPVPTMVRCQMCAVFISG